MKINQTVRRIRKRQHGIYAIEFAIYGSLFFLLLFTIIELGRLFFVWNVLTEATRRGARLATVCHLDQIAVTAYTDMLNTALFNNLTIVPNLTATNLNIQYLGLNGIPATDFNSIRLVRATITNYQHQLLIPGLGMTLNSPSFSTTLPRESLGVTRYKYTQCAPI
jgi:hypothetical protein